MKLVEKVPGKASGIHKFLEVCCTCFWKLVSCRSPLLVIDTCGHIGLFVFSESAETSFVFCYVCFDGVL